MNDLILWDVPVLVHPIFYRKKAREYYESDPPSDRHSCSMCGKMCAMRTTNRILNGEKVELLENK